MMEESVSELCIMKDLGVDGFPTKAPNVNLVI